MSIEFHRMLPWIHAGITPARERRLMYNRNRRATTRTDYIKSVNQFFRYQLPADEQRAWPTMKSILAWPEYSALIYLEPGAEDEEVEADVVTEKMCRDAVSMELTLKRVEEWRKHWEEHLLRLQKPHIARFASQTDVGPSKFSYSDPSSLDLATRIFRCGEFRSFLPLLVVP